MVKYEKHNGTALQYGDQVYLSLNLRFIYSHYPILGFKQNGRSVKVCHADRERATRLQCCEICQLN